jgi:hypothetical protein
MLAFWHFKLQKCLFLNKLLYQIPNLQTYSMTVNALKEHHPVRTFLSILYGAGDARKIYFI